MALPPPQGSLSGARDWVWVVVVVFLVVFVPLRSPSADEPPPLDADWPDWTDWSDCAEARRWPTFCSALLNTSILNDTARRRVRDMLPRAKAFFCDMVRVLNKIDCAQPFTVSPRWKLGCQEAYRDWSCSLLAEGLLPVGLNSCDSTCHQVIRVCPYLSPDRVQVEASGKPALHPSQYGGHPAFHCPTTYTDSNHRHTEDYFFRRTDLSPDELVCILFNPSEAGLSHTSFPLRSLDLRNLTVTYCQDYGANHDDPHPLLTDSRGRVNVSQCCWTYNSALPVTYNSLSSTLRRSVLEDKNCLSLESSLLEENPLLPPSDQETRKQVVLQCLVTQDTSSPARQGLDPDEADVPLYVEDPPAPPDAIEEEDPPPDRFTSAEGEDYDEEDEEYDFPRASSTTEAFLSLIASLDSSHAQQSSTTSNWRERRSLATDAPNATPSQHCSTRVPTLLLLFVSLLLLPPLLFTSLEWTGLRESRRSQCSRWACLPEQKPMSQSVEWVTQPIESRRPRQSHSLDWERRRKRREWACPGRRRRRSIGSAADLRRSQSPSTPSTTITTSTTTSQGRSNEWRRLWSYVRPCPRSYSLQRIT